MSAITPFRVVHVRGDFDDRDVVVVTRAGRTPATLPLPAYVAAVDLADAEHLVGTLTGGPFAGARLLLTHDELPLGLVDLDVRDGRPDLAPVRRIARTTGRTPATPSAPGEGTAAARRSLCVAVCTRRRPGHLRDCLEVLCTHGGFDELLVVDNDEESGGIDEVVAAFAGRGHALRYVREPRRGVSAARNRALRETGCELVAFVDDDVRVSAPWWRAVRAAFTATDGAPACVTGPVLPAALATAEQLAADEALGWCKGFDPRRYSLAEPAASPIFPFSPGLFGFGANVVVDRAVARDLGGFDEELGPGSRARSGEDIDFFIRLILAGHALAYEPAAYVWHHHREGVDQFRDQLVGYGMGLGAFIAKVATVPFLRRRAVHRVGAAAVHLARLSRHEARSGVGGPTRALRLAAMARGFAAYAWVTAAGERTGSRRSSCGSTPADVPRTPSSPPTSASWAPGPPAPPLPTS